ncbi:MAG: hypothetical protein ACJ8J0_12315 [Longimicrobiaceae bacterium]
MGPEYTSCVEESDFAELSKAYLAVLGAAIAFGGFAAVFTGGSSLLITGAALLEAIRYVLDWLLHGKLICLHRKSAVGDCICGGPSGTRVCAIGEVVTTENVGEDKNPAEDIDDDYAINLALFPFEMPEFAKRGFIDWKPDFLDDESAPFWTYKQDLFQLATSAGHPQGDLVTRQVSRHGTTRKFGYLTTMVMLKGGEYLPYTDVVGRDAGSNEDERWADYEQKNKKLLPERFSVPVLHCEFEGSRTRDRLAALEGFPFGKSFCKKNWFTKLVCRVVAAVLAPIALLALALAWARNTKGSTGPAIADGRPIGPKSRVIVRGSWRYDAGHDGWNEIHAVRVVQTVDNVPPDPTEFKAFLHTWCERLAETPMTDGAPRRGPLSVGVSSPQDVPAAGLTLVAQGQPENQWTFHPLVDGCRPADRPPDELPPIH